VKGGLVGGRAPKMHSIFGGNRARHLHLGREHAHVSSHEGMVLLGVPSLILLA
jgi:hypothetical protein